MAVANKACLIQGKENVEIHINSYELKQISRLNTDNGRKATPQLDFRNTCCSK